jgi:phosphatidylglycerol:prolipoprotein diacylglycerol transferase
MISYPNISPYFLNIGPFALRWYGLAYIVGLLCGGWVLKPVFKQRFLMSWDDVFNLMSAVIIGMLVGGRVGYILFYDLSFYLQTPSEVLAVWHGGMSFHGGILGGIAAVYIWCRQAKRPFLGILDGVAAVTPIGLLLGRLANFVNGELYGRITDVPWAMVFPNGGIFPRHPSQLYEAFFEGLVLFAILYPLLKRSQNRPGRVVGWGLMLYGVMRFCIEFFREPDAQVGLLGVFSMGQWLCLGMVAIGLIVFIFCKSFSKR